MLLRGLLIGICTLGTFTLLLKAGETLRCARTGALITLVMSQLIHVFECKSEEKTLFTVPLFNNGFLIFAVTVSSAVLFSGIYIPVLSQMFQTAVPDLLTLIVSLASAFLVPVMSGVTSSLKKCRRRTFDISANKPDHTSV